MRWFLSVNGEECTDPGPVDAALVQDLATGVSYDLVRPISIVGICHQFGEGNLLDAGVYNIELMSAPCEATNELNTNVPGPADATTGYNSVSRFIVEELPASRHNCTAQIVEPTI